MKFQDAKDKLEKLAKGKYHTIRYELTEYRSGKQCTRCTLYVDGGPNFVSQTFQECFDLLEGKLEELPDIEG